MKIEKGDIIITENGQVRELDFDDDTPADAGYVHPSPLWDAIKVDAPLRIKVSTEREARFVVEEAEEAGFKNSLNKGIYSNDCEVIQLNPDEMIKFWQPDKDPDLTFSDLDQWRAWISYHADGRRRAESGRGVTVRRLRGQGVGTVSDQTGRRDLYFPGAWDPEDVLEWIEGNPWDRTGPVMAVPGWYVVPCESSNEEADRGWTP